MPVDYSLEVRKAVVAHLVADEGVTALVSAEKIWGEEIKGAPSWPFIKLGFIITTPFEATDWDGSAHRVTVHAFSKGPFTDAVAQINKAVVAAMDTVAVPGLGTVDLQWRSTDVVRDTDESSAYHGINQFDFTVAA